MDFKIRNEKESDFFKVENLTREAFWNVYRPGCDEHLLVHNLRSLPCFIKELDFVAEIEGNTIGHIIYSRSRVVDNNGKRHEFIAFGPLSVHLDFQRKGIGKALIEHSFKIAAELGYTAVFITGNPAYYSRYGFVSASNYDIHLKGVAAEDKADYFMVKLLNPTALDGVTGVFEFDECYNVDKSQLDDFDKFFTPKIKEVRPGQFGS